jgi:NAD(P)-dependent dehydrogenase (short-subunit alcohol dehydrogenase family)
MSVGFRVRRLNPLIAARKGHRKMDQDPANDLKGRVVIVTGAGRGLGREHALFLASRGAKVVVNDLGGSLEGEDADVGAAEAVAREIRDQGGEAVANSESITDWEAGARLVETALSEFGGLHAIVNNAGIDRERSFPDMSEQDWDSVLAVHLRGHFVTTRHASAYWRAEHNAGRPVRASVINTTSRAGLYPGRPNKQWAMNQDGKANYAVAKAGIAALTLALASELSAYDIRVNAIAPVARTRMTMASDRLKGDFARPSEGARFDAYDPANVSPVVGWLASEDCAVTGQVYFVYGGTVQPMVGWTRDGGISKQSRWSISELRGEAGRLTVAQPTGDAGR